jgi:hypothetical protein
MNFLNKFYQCVLTVVYYYLYLQRPDKFVNQLENNNVDLSVIVCVNIIFSHFIASALYFVSFNKLHNKVFTIQINTCYLV